MAMIAETKRPGTNILCLWSPALRREIIEYEMMDVEKCTTMYIESIVNMSQSQMSGLSY
jgi:hypothetical protein